MRHWIVAGTPEMLPNWRAALSEAVVLTRNELTAIPTAQPGIVWYRCHAGESLSGILSNVHVGPAQFLVVLADEPDESIVLEAMRLGAQACCNTFAAPEVLGQVAVVVRNGGLWVGQGLLQRLVSSTAKNLQLRLQPVTTNEAWSERLSEREVQVARMVAGGASNKEIANRLSITERTVKAHLSAIFEKLGLRDRLQLSLKVNGLAM